MKKKMNHRRTCALILFALLCGGAKGHVTDDMNKWLGQSVEQRAAIETQTFGRKPLSVQEAVEVQHLLFDRFNQENGSRFSDFWKSRRIQRDSLTMRFKFRVYGEKPADGRSLYISMHGGGGTTPEVNDGQWDNQILLYHPREGVYVAPRSLENVWDMWFRPYLDGFYDELIESAVAVYGVNPDKVYITGYSAGGDGTFRMAPRMADRWAAALMCAGHPGNTSPVGLRNLPFGMWIGLMDGAYERNLHGKEWCAALAALHQADPEGYVANTNMPMTGHWMNQQDTLAFHWMGQFRRNAYPRRVVWKQDSTYLNTTMYWLSMPKESVKPGGLIVAEHYGNEFTIHECYAKELTIGLNDEMIDYRRPVVVRFRGREVFRGKVRRTAADIYAAWRQRKDVRYAFPTLLRLTLDAD